MPKRSLHALIWSEVHQHYELYIHGQPEQCFRRGDEPAFSRWLAQHTSFAFVGQAGRLSVIKEARPCGTGYWYAYRTQDRHTRKRYLGRTAWVTFARLEDVAETLTAEPRAATDEHSQLKGGMALSRHSAVAAEERGTDLQERVPAPLTTSPSGEQMPWLAPKLHLPHRRQVKNG